MYTHTKVYLYGFTYWQSQLLALVPAHLVYSLPRQVMIVHQQLAALTGKPGSKKKKKHVTKDDGIDVEVDDPLFVPSPVTSLSKKPSKKPTKKPPPTKPKTAPAPKKATPPSK